jgi:hypothetical protein
MGDWAYFLALIAAAASFALMEIQVEGAGGWAANLPTWRLNMGWWARLFPGRPLTGYHLSILVFIAIVAHLPFAFGLPWTRSGECQALAFVLFFWVLEDFFWFVLNPHFGVRKFRKECIPWHANAWWWIAPRDYWIAGILGILLYWFSHEERKTFMIAMR